MILVSLKHAIGQNLCKKQTNKKKPWCRMSPKNYPPISKWPFISKLMEKALVSKLSQITIVLVLLDLSHTVDHSCLLARLEQQLGIRGTALKWLNSNLRHKTFSVCVGQFSSFSATVPYGVPQRSILGPGLFCFYMLPVGSIIRKIQNLFSFLCWWFPAVPSFEIQWFPAASPGLSRGYQI